MKKQRLLFTLLMAIVMMAFSPTRAWAQDDDGGDYATCLHESIIYTPSGYGDHSASCEFCREVFVDSESCQYENGVCKLCGYHCEHNWNYETSSCQICGMVCNHSYDSDGSCTTCGTTCEIVSVTIGGNTERYNSLWDALTGACKAGEPATITLLQDINLQSNTITIAAGNVTLDLNGHTVTASFTSNDASVLVLSAGSLTIMDSSGDNSGMIQTNINYAVNATGGSITIHGGTFKTKTGPAFYVANANVNVSLDGGRYTGTYGIILGGKSALAPGYSYYITDTDTELADITKGSVMTAEGTHVPDITVKPGIVKATLTIDGVTTNYVNFLSAYDNAISSERPVTMKILKNVDLVNNNKPYSLDMDKGEIIFDLNGCTVNQPLGSNVFNISGAKLTFIDSSAGKTGMVMTRSGNAVNATGGSITIHGGTFKTNSGPAFFAVNSNVNVSLDGGRYTGTYGIILGGKSALAPGYSYYITDTDTELADITSGPVKTAEGTPAPDITVKSGIVKATLTIDGVTTNYVNFLSAYDNAISSERPVTLKILKNVDLVDLVNDKKPYPLNMDRGEIIFDLNGCTVNQPNGGNVFNISGAKLTFIDSSAGKTGTVKTCSGNALSVTGGSITIHDGTFITERNGNAFAIYHPDSSVDAFVDGGRFIDNTTQEFQYPINTADIYALASGYAYYNASTGEKLNATKGYIKDNDGKCVRDIIVKALPVVSVTTGSGTIEYTDIVVARDAACEAGEPATITMLQDCTMPNGDNLAFKMGEVTLDLNGHTLTGAYTAVIDVRGGALTITDSSAEKTGTIVNSMRSIDAYHGTLTIHGGTFISNKYNALFCNPDDEETLTVSIDGGRFISKGENSAIFSKIADDILAPGYGFFNTDTGALLTAFDENNLMDENGNPAQDVTVKPLLIDELALADATQYDGENAGCTVTDFTYTRNFGGTNWTTWYVPFDLELTDEICQKLAFSRINNVHQYDDDDNGTPDRTVIESFRQKAGVTLRANYPYLVKALNDADRNVELHLSNVTLAPARENSIDCNSVDYIYTFTGTYSGMSDSGANSNSPYALFDDVADNQWYHFHNLEPQRHYMVIEPVNGSLAPRSLKVRLNVLGEEDATGIVTIYSEKEKMQGETYDLMGRKLTGNSAQRGLRIQNGKVIFNK